LIDMNKAKVTPKTRNWVAKHNHHRAVIMRVRTWYQRQPKHRNREVQ